MNFSHRAAGIVLAAALAAGTANAITLDGQLDPEYGAPLAVQTVSAYAGDNLRGVVSWSDGSEMDAVHAAVSGGTLYLFFAGNQLSRENPSDPGFFADHLHLFFDTRPGGQDVLRSDNFDVGAWPGHSVLNAMAGLRFDGGFAPDWWLSDFATGDPTWVTGPFTLHAWRAELLDGGGGPGEYLGSTSAGATPGLAGGVNPLGIGVAIDNRNVGGVPGGCAVASGAGITTGIEWAIPLAAIGDPAGCVRLCALFTYKGGFTTRNQFLPPLPAGSCALYPTATLDLGAFAGAQFLEFCELPSPATRRTWGSLKRIAR